MYRYVIHSDTHGAFRLRMMKNILPEIKFTVTFIERKQTFKQVSNALRRLSHLYNSLKVFFEHI